MSRNEAEYYEHRAEVQIELAQKATDAKAVKAHYELATAYLDKVHGEEEAIAAE